MDPLDFSRMQDDHEAANWAACFDAAEIQGYSVDRAQECDDGELKCHHCPFHLVLDALEPVT